MAFRVGMEVVCIQRMWYFDHPKYLDAPAPDYGEVYTIAAIHSDGNLYLKELPITPPNEWNEQFDLRWDPIGLRPVQKRKTSIECFTALLNTKSVREDA